MTRRVVFVLLVCGVLMSAARNASAQGTEVGVSYANLTLIGSEGGENTTYPFGWIVALSGRIDPHIAVVGEINGNYHRESFGTTDLSSDIYTFLAGPRVLSVSGKMTFFGQLLVGLSHSRIGATGFPSASDNGFAIQPGVGVDLSLAPRRALRVQADVPFYRSEGNSSHAFRFGVGIVFDLQ